MGSDRALPHRRLDGTHITVIAVAVCVALTPAGVFAADYVTSVIVDPQVPTAQARVSDDGRLGVRGETTAQQGVPSNAWDRVVTQDERRSAFLIRTLVPPVLEPPDSAIGVSQLTVSPGRGGWPAGGADIALVATPAPYAGCGSPCPGPCPISAPSDAEVRYRFRAGPAGSVDHAQVTFPVPLTVGRPSPSADVCLYVRTDVDGKIVVSANGVIGTPTASFAPAGTKA